MTPTHWSGSSEPGYADKGSRTTRWSRRGITVMEVVISLGLLATILVTVGQLAFAVSGFRRNSQQRRIAIREASNIMDQIIGLNISSAGKLTLSPEAQRTLPSGRVVVKFGTPQPGKLQSVQVEVHWVDRVGNSVTPVSLAAWRSR